MLESLRGRLLAWYSLILVLVIGAFGATVCFVYWRSLIREITLDLGTRAAVIAAAVRPAPNGAFDLELPAGTTRDFGGPAERAPYYAIYGRRGAYRGVGSRPGRAAGPP